MREEVTVGEAGAAADVEDAERPVAEAAPRELEQPPSLRLHVEVVLATGKGDRVVELGLVRLVEAVELRLHTCRSASSGSSRCGSPANPAASRRM